MEETYEERATYVLSLGTNLYWALADSESLPVDPQNSHS